MYLQTEDNMEFDMIGVYASIANALRRILIPDICACCHLFLQWKIEKVLMVDNTSVTADEVLSHRLGLIPFPLDAKCTLFIISQAIELEAYSLRPKKNQTLEYVVKGMGKFIPSGLQLLLQPGTECSLRKFRAAAASITE
uniref:Uncharacterized protein n=2 Tax=Oryza meridionalis TaxID=40149 RepID=A0A0E0ELN9_9ORYZ